MPAYEQPPTDRRKNVELSDDEVRLKIAEREAKLAIQRLRVRIGFAAGVVGLFIGTYAVLVQQNNVGALIGFVVMAVGGGIATLGQVQDLISSVLGRGGNK